MRRWLVAAALAASTLAVTPAYAQNGYGGYGFGPPGYGAPSGGMMMPGQGMMPPRPGMPMTQAAAQPTTPTQVPTTDSAPQNEADCLAQMSRTVGPLLQQAAAYSPNGYSDQGFAPLMQPFTGSYLGAQAGLPAALYGQSAAFTGLTGSAPPPYGYAAPAMYNWLVRTRAFNPSTPDPQTAINLANLQQTDFLRQQTQALLQQQQGLYLNSLYQLNASYQVTALDWMTSYSILAQAMMGYYRDLCRGRQASS